MQNLSPPAWALRPLKRYAEFSGRSSRAEFWWFMLGLMIFFVLLWLLFVGAMFGSIAAAGEGAPSAGVLSAIGFGGILVCLIWLALIIPSIAVQVRRLHDTDRSGWWLGAFYLLYALYFAVMFGGVGLMADGSADANVGMVTGAMLLAFVLFVYMIVLIVFYCLPGTKGANRYGEDPYGADVAQVFA